MATRVPGDGLPSALPAASHPSSPSVDLADRPPGAPLPPADPEVVRVLRGAGLFRSFTDTGVAILAGIARPKRIPAGAPLFVENMIGDGLFVVAEGRLRLAVRGPRGEEVALATVGPGESVGEAALLRPGPRLCSATAEVPTLVLEIDRRDVAALQRSKPQACLKLMMGVVDLVGERLREGEDDLRQFLAWRLGL